MADNGSQNVADVEMSDVQSPPLMTEDEKRVLEVYDRLEQLQLEIALLKAQGVLSQGESSICYLSKSLGKNEAHQIKGILLDDNFKNRKCKTSN